LLQEGLSALNVALDAATLFAADVGPGSFTGVRVGVTLAKALAYLRGVPAYGASAFDLIDAAQSVIVPSKRGEWFVREPGQEPVRVSDLTGISGIGYGPGIEVQQYPSAAGFTRLPIGGAPPEMLVPAYLVPPSISMPKKPYGGEVAR
jgi:hypothetical protein